MAQKNESANFSFGIHPRAHARGSLLISIAIVTFNGIEKKADWVYYLALTRITRNWMKRKKRYWVAFVPLYFVAISQGVAVAAWIYLMA